MWQWEESDLMMAGLHVSEMVMQKEAPGNWEGMGMESGNGCFCVFSNLF